MIPKFVYQTWKTKELPIENQTERDTMIQNNPEYTFILFDDNDMDTWMKDNMNDEVNIAYNSLSVGAAKADLWRYCILYKQGGIYLDIDSTLLEPLHTFIHPEDSVIVSRESNEKMFLQWLLIASPHHPIFERAITIAVCNIINKVSTNVSILTGPKAFTFALSDILIPLYSHDVDLWFEPDANLNEVLNVESKEKCRFLGFDFRDAYTGVRYARWKSDSANELYKNNPHWLSYDTPFKNGY
jgi:mannosyltransferase OCH1-like enzyme